MSGAYLQILGSFECGVDGAGAIHLPTRKAKALLSYLAVNHGRTHTREKLGALLWAESGGEQQRESLRQTLTMLRKALPQPVRDALTTVSDTVALKSDIIAVDAVIFQRLAQSSSMDDLEQAAVLYRGEFLEGFTLREPEFDDWTSAMRSAFSEKAAVALNTLLVNYSAEGSLDRSIATATRLLALDPFRETAHRALMELYSAQGRGGAALRHFETLRDRLRQELSVEPEAATTSLWRRIREQRGRPREPEPGIVARPPPSAPVPIDARPQLRQGLERRHITILVCELCGLEALCARCDPEDVQQVISACRGRVGEIISGFGGVVARFSGDGMMVYFGYPVADEHGAEQGVRAGLALVESLPGLDLGFAASLHPRVGIASGSVVLGGMPDAGGASQALIGEAGKRATLLQSLAGPATVLIADSTRQLVKDLFQYAPPMADGIGAPGAAQAWCVTGESRASRFEAAHGGASSAFFGREAELAALLDGWRRAKAGEGSLRHIVGEAGIGKSRLAQAFRQQIESEAHRFISFQCSPFHTNSPLRPIIQHLERAANILARDLPSEKMAKLKALLASVMQGADEPVALIATLLAIPQAEAPLGELSPAQRRRKTLSALLTYVTGRAAGGPVLMLFEDIHWADASSREWLDLLVEHIPRLNTLVLTTSRPGEENRWSAFGHVETLALAGVGAASAKAIIAEISAGKTLPADLVEQIIERADGVPLFVEELARAIVESGGEIAGDDAAWTATGTTPLAIPTTLRDSLAARLDRIGTGKAVAQVGATIGREFSFLLIEALDVFSSDQLHDGLTRLISSGLVHERRLGASTQYVFKHALVQDAAYESLPRSRRRWLHGAIAAAVLAHSPAPASAQPEIVAHHYAQAQMPMEALSFWLKAGQLAADRYATKEAIAHFRQGVDLLKTAELPEEQKRRWELCFLTELGPAVMAVHGYGAGEGQAVFQRAYELLSDATPNQQLRILSGLWNICFHRGDVAAALPLARRALEMARACGQALDVAKCQMGQTLSSMGEFETARVYFQEVIDSYRTTNILKKGHFLVDEPVLALAYMARILWSLGFPDSSMRAAEDAVAVAQKSGNAVSIATAMVGRMFMATHGLPAQEAVAMADDALSFCREHGLVLFEHWIRFNQGALLARQGQVAAGVEVMEQAIAAAEARQSFQFRPFQLSCIGAAYLHLGESTRALGLLDNAIALAETGGERQSFPALHRIKGQMLVQLGRRQEAWRMLQLALSIARRQQARLEMLRIATAMLKQAAVDHPDEEQQARNSLREIIDFFDEGHDLPELRASRELLAAHENDAPN